MLSKDKLYYLASPYSHPDEAVRGARYKEVTDVAAELVDRYGLKFILPITTSYHLGKSRPSIKGCWEYWKATDLLYISKCDAVMVFMMEGWEESVGVTAEIEYAKENKIPIIYLAEIGYELSSGDKYYIVNEADLYNRWISLKYSIEETADAVH